MDHALGEDTHPLTILQREVEEMMKKEVDKADKIMSGPTINQEMVQEQFYFWLHSFSRRVLDTMLYEVSLLIQPKQSEARQVASSGADDGVPSDCALSRARH